MAEGEPRKIIMPGDEEKEARRRNQEKVKESEEKRKRDAKDAINEIKRDIGKKPGEKKAEIKALTEGEPGKNLPVKGREKLPEKITKGKIIKAEGKVMGEEPKRLYEGGKGENLPAVIKKTEEAEPETEKKVAASLWGERKKGYPEGSKIIEGKERKRRRGSRAERERVPPPEIRVSAGREEPREEEPEIEVPEHRRAGQRLILRPEVRRERPWRGELISDVGISIGKDREPMKKAIEELIKRREVEYAKEWWQDNQELIEQAGYDFDNSNEKYIVDKTRKLGGFAGIENDNDHNHLFASREALKKDKISPDRAQIILHQLQGRKDMLEGEIDDAREVSNKRLAKSKKKESERLLGIRERLAGKIEGKNLRQEAKDETWLSSLRRKKTIDRKVEEKIRQIDTYETGLGNVQERFDGARQIAEEELMVDYMEAKIKKDPNAARAWKAMERAHEIDEEVLKPKEVVKEAFTRQERGQGPLSDLEEGGWEVNRGHILQFFNFCGYAFNPAHIDLANTRLEARGDFFRKALEGDAGLVYRIIRQIFEILKIQAEERENAAEGG